MQVTVLDRVPLERITAETRQVQPGRLLLTLIAGFFYLIGWTAAKLLVGVVWCCVAVKVGYLEAGGPVKRKAGRGPAG
jgi:hypothetical protein